MGPALRAAIALLRRTRDGDVAALDLRIAVHGGAAVAATFDGRLEYFGETVERALELGVAAPPGVVVVSPALSHDPAVQHELEAHSVATELAPCGGDEDFGLHVH